MNKDDLKTCPFCGGEAEIDFNSVKDFGGYGHQLGWCECLGCGVEYDFEFNADDPSINPTKELVNKWNTRTPQSEWVSVDDALPPIGNREDKSTHVLCLLEDGSYQSCYILDDANNWESVQVNYSHHDVTHWMPLPSPPKGG